jgi:hypothetical protein
MAASKKTKTKTKTKAKAKKTTKPATPKQPVKKAVARKPAPASKPAAAPKGGGSGTRASPWQLTTPPGTSAFTAYSDETADPPALVVKVGSTELRYHLRAIHDLHAMLKAHGDWMPLGGADEQKPAASGTVEAWGRDETNPIGGWYGLKKGLRGRFAVYLPAVLERLGTAEVTHDAKNNRMRAK